MPETKHFKHLIPFIIQLDGYRKPPVSLIAAERFFHQGEYAWAIKEIKDALGINTNIKIKVLKKKDLRSPACIEIPTNLFQTFSAQSHIYRVFIREQEFHSFGIFCMVLAHELSHLFLFTKGSHLWANEKAVDTLAIIAGFGNYFKSSRVQDCIIQSSTYGYLDDAEFNFVYSCFSLNRRFKEKEKTTLPWYKKIFSLKSRFR